MRGPVAAMSFDPGLMAALREIAPGLPRGHRGRAALRHRSAPAHRAKQRTLALPPAALAARPQFLAYRVQGPDLRLAADRAKFVAPAVADLDGAQRTRTAPAPPAMPTR